MITYRTTRSLLEGLSVLPMLQHLNNDYPGFSDWFVNTSLPDVVTGNSTMLLAENGSEIVGVGLVKNEDQKKIRCIRVLPHWQRRGIGIHLIERCLRILDCDRPLVTVSEGMINDFARPLVNHFDFKLNHVAKGLYRPGKLEYVFNGNL